MMDSGPEEYQPSKTKAICILLISCLVYVTPIICLISAEIYYYNENISENSWIFWNFATFSCLIIYFLIDCLQLIGEVKYENTVFEKIELLGEEEQFQKSLKKCKDAKLVIMTIYFILSAYGFYISYNVLTVLESDDYRHGFYLALFLYCTFSLLIFILPVIIFLFIKILNIKSSLREKTAGCLKGLV
ncbi:hypothetical protein B9Z55_020871 [Caenorhabditis nigoni]|uniref:Uncharacterized protein n=1 Tax=Caenorhabditis nigoni TaxID=1611254 RepID=A0A2G5TPH3_9PELO|nr:hypothetical protein B9Z55_020871 [Caenorhabditis nigoni]